MTTAPITRVTGGVAGMAATYAAVRALADRYDAAGDRMRGWAATGGRTLVDPDLLESAPLSPVTFAEAEEKIAAATTGVHGILVDSVVYEADALLVRATVDAFEECDRVVRASFRTLDYLVGRTVGYDIAAVAPLALALGVVAAPAVRLAWDGLPAPARDDLDCVAEATADRAEEWLDEHPAVEQHLADGDGGLLDGLLAGTATFVPAAVLGLSGFHPTSRDAAADLAALYGPEGPPHVHRRRDLWVRLGETPPRDLAGLIHHLAQTNHLSTAYHPADQGTIEIQTLHAPDGSVRYIVYLPGTDDMTTTPLSQDGDVRDLATDLHLMAGHDTTYAEGIQQAMTRAGIGPHDPVLLAGHSQGGMEAAAMLSRGTGFHITHVVTAGSPIAQVHGYPPGSHVLSLENRGDVVPLLDGQDNPDSRQQVTVQFDDHETSIAGNHLLHHYVRGAAEADASTDPSIREQVRSLREHGFLGSRATATSRVYQITR
jgi:hypothetical protein